MKRSVWLTAVAAVCALSVAGQGRSAEFLGGLEQWQSGVGLDRTNDPADTDSYEAHHALVAGTVEWSANENVKVRMTLGPKTLTSNLETNGQDLDGSSDGWYFSLGALLEQELASGGGLLVDGSLGWGWAEWSDGADDLEYNHFRTGFLLGYIWGEGERARPYAGLAYNTYESEFLGETGDPDKQFENERRFSLVAGIRARTSTFVGVMEASLMGETGVRAGLLFGF